MKKSTILYCLYYLIMLCMIMLDYCHIVRFDFPLESILLGLLTVMLITRIPFPNSILSNINSVERLAEEQRKYVFMKWSTFFRIVMPLVFYVVLKAMW